MTNIMHVNLLCLLSWGPFLMANHHLLNLQKTLLHMKLVDLAITQYVAKENSKYILWLALLGRLGIGTNYLFLSIGIRPLFDPNNKKSFRDFVPYNQIIKFPTDFS